MYEAWIWGDIDSILIFDYTIFTYEGRCLDVLYRNM